MEAKETRENNADSCSPQGDDGAVNRHFLSKKKRDSLAQVTALALYSGGLDSMLACRVVAELGIRVVAVKFVSPFFGYDLLADEEAHCRQVREKYGIEMVLRDVSEKYLAMLRNPTHGYGKNFNPCVDCKILLLSEAKRMMAEFGASFLITGEVIGQRPMSQRRDTLRVIERDSGCEGILVRPLCAQKMPETQAEQDGLIDRQQLLDFCGRGRQSQIALAAKFGITDYPTPSGGCSLTDANLSIRIERFHQERETVRVADARLLLAGRQFGLPDGGWLALGRGEEENSRLEHLAIAGDLLLKCISRPGPVGLLRFAGSDNDIRLAAAITVRYGKKGQGKVPAVVQVTKGDGASDELTVLPASVEYTAELAR